MDAQFLITTIISIVAVVLAVPAAIVAIRQALDAKKSREAAETARDETRQLEQRATAAAERSAAAQERANELEEDRRRPQPWSEPRPKGDGFTIVNTSGRTITVDAYDADPPEMQNLLLINALGPDLAPGDSFDAIPVRTIGGSPRKMTVRWHYSDETEPRTLIVPL